jgi:hypothetical protein
MDALEYLDQRGWLTTRGVNCAFKVYGLNKDRRSALQQFLSAQGRDAEVALIQDAMPTV